MTCVSSLYLPGLAEVCTPRSSSDGARSPRSRSTRTLGACSEPDRMTGPSRPSRSTRTSDPSTGAHGAESTSSQAVSPAKTSASQDAAPGSTASDRACGPSTGGSSPRSSRRSSSPRTRLTSPAEASIEFCATLPRSGSMRSGRLYRRAPLALPTVATAFGFLLPTLTASNYGSNRGGAAGRNGPDRPSLQTMARRGQLSALPLLPTLTVKGNYNKRGLSPRSGDGLATALARITPGPGGPLNPDWADWFMGWPIGATASAPLETGRFRSWLRSQLASLRDVSASRSDER